MKRILMPGAFTALLLAATIGCDSKSTTDNNLPAGNVSDPEFQAASEAVAFSEQTDMEMLGDIYNVIGQIDISNSAPGRERAFARFASSASSDSFVATYNSTSQYWTVYFSYVNPFDSSSWVYQDSIQFRNNNVPQQWPDTTVDEIRAGKSLNVIYNGGSNAQTPVRNPNLNRVASSGSIEAHRLWTITGEIPQQGNVVVNGSGTTDVIAENVGDDSCNWDVSLASTVNNLALNMTDIRLGGCPTGGSINHNGMIAVSCTGANSGTFNDTWTQTVTYTPNGITVTASNSRATWTWSGSCDDRPGDDNHDEGDDNADENRAFQKGIGEVLDATGDMADFVFEASLYISTLRLSAPSLPSRETASRLAVDSASAVYNAETQYWNVYLQITDPQNGTTATITDAIQFRENGEPAQWPDSALTTSIHSEMEAHFALSEPGMLSAASGAMNASHNWLFESVEGPIWDAFVVADGPVHFNGDFSAGADSITCAYGFEVRGEIENVKFAPSQSESGNCPIDGVIELGGDFSLNCEGPNGSLDLSDQWTARFAYNDDGSHNYRFENTRNYWEGSRECDPGIQSASSRARGVAAK